MAESYKCKRVKFLKGQQARFILDSKEALRVSWDELAKLSGVSRRTLFEWRKENFLMSYKAVRALSKKTGEKFPNGTEILNPFWYAPKGARKGGLAVLKKYGKIGGDENRRKEKWREWWEKEGKLSKESITNPRPFKRPRKCIELAEFVGIVLGDGGISAKQVTITLHRVTDREYADYVKKLIGKLFGVPVGVYSSPRYLADNYIISRVGLVDFLVEEMGLKKGNKIKNRIDIPDWIKENNKFSMACLRGLVDTDGSIFIHKYFSRGKQYGYKKMSYCSRSLPLLKSASIILNKLDIGHRFTKDNFEIRIESQENLNKYFCLVGSSNPKHLKKYKK